MIDRSSDSAGPLRGRFAAPIAPRAWNANTQHIKPAATNHGTYRHCRNVSAGQRRMCRLTMPADDIVSMPLGTIYIRLL